MTTQFTKTYATMSIEVRPQAVLFDGGIVPCRRRSCV